MDSAAVISARVAIEKAASTADAETRALEKFCAGIIDFAKEAGIPEEYYNDFVKIAMSPVTATLLGRLGSIAATSGLGAGAGALLAGPKKRGKGALGGALIGGGLNLAGSSVLGGGGALAGGTLGALMGDKKTRARNALIGALAGGTAGTGASFGLRAVSRAAKILEPLAAKMREDPQYLSKLIERSQSNSRQGIE